jgi:hypothetical protein
MASYISLFTGEEYTENSFLYRATFLNGRHPTINQMQLQIFALEMSIYQWSKSKNKVYIQLSENLYQIHIEDDNNIFILGNAGGEDDGIDAIAQAEKYKDGYAINIIGKTYKPKFPNREEKDLIIALSKLFPIYSGEIILFKMFAIWKELSEAGIPILVHDVFDEIPDKAITCDELNYYFDPAIDTKRFRFKVNQSVDQKRKQ